MSKFLGKQAASLTPYTPGEQPQDRRYIKLNTNECPYPPSPLVAKALAEDDAGNYRLYPDPTAGALRQKLAEHYGVAPNQVFVGNGSDEVLAFAFFAFFDRGDKISFPDPSYGFYPVYADLCGLNANPIPLKDDFTIDPNDFAKCDGNIIIANPNAPTGLWLERNQIEQILAANPDRLVMIDEAYADFANEGVDSLPLLPRHENLLIIGTFSKSRAFAGLRLGYAISTPEIIAELERIRYSFNPYNVSRPTQLAGVASLEDETHFQWTLEKVKATRERVTARLRELGLDVLPSATNFLFVTHPRLDGRELYLALRENGILVRCFDHPRTLRHARISVGSDEEMDALLSVIEKL
ncbi:MAG: histidinol-phosphate transaminase [Oscillospiraceae bacterium]|nr:histidinol-phosphate transaminase [Oscillospiraceae bacterium]